MAVALRSGVAVAVLGMLVGCGGGGGGGGGNASPGNNGSSGSGGYTAGVFQPSSTFAAQCASPRAGTSDRQGSITSQNNFLRSWSNELYLWYREVPDLNPASFATADYFDRLKSSAVTSSGQPKDQFHFVYDTAEWLALSQAGVEVGYGAQWLLLSGAPPRRIVVAYTEPGSPATAGSANLTRGVEVITADGVDVINGNSSAAVDTLNAAFFPTAAGQSHTFTIRELSGSTRSVTMTSASITSSPVQFVKTIPTGTGTVGYLLFNDHIATSEPALVNAINTLNGGAGITDLILDIRYNGGGYLDIASELAYMIGGSNTLGRTFERQVFNDKHPTTNPVTGRALTPTPFHTTTQILSPTGQGLPTLNLPRVYVITGSNTCSASEAIINGLRGVDMQVFQIGSTTCGKPYGFYPQDNCGTTYFSIQFQGLNAKDFGAYPDGFSPANTVGVHGENLPGCSVGDDFSLGLGDENERRLAATLAFRSSSNQSCPAASGFGPNVVSKPGQSLSAAEGMMQKSPWRENRILVD
jgi:carboxyl-terminal processing protease